MCQELLPVSLVANDLKKVVEKLQNGKYSYNPEWTPYKIAREILNQEFEGMDEAATFSTACRLEDRLINKGIGGNDTNRNLLPALPPTSETPAEKLDFERLAFL